MIHYVKPGFCTMAFSFSDGGGGSNQMKSDVEAEKTRIEQAIRDTIEWPYPEKNKERLFTAIAQDSSFFIFHPDSKSTIIGFDAFRNLVEKVFMNPTFKATGSDIRNLRIDLSRSGEVAWFSAILDDYGESNGKSYAWLNTRWTGVLEKREGKWLMIQMHFSFASDEKRDDS